MIIWTYRLMGTPERAERVQATITAGGKGSITRPLDELPAGAFPSDHFPAHADLAREVAGCPIQLLGGRASGAGFIFQGFPDEKEEDEK